MSALLQASGKADLLLSLRPVALLSNPRRRPHADLWATPKPLLPPHIRSLPGLSWPLTLRTLVAAISRLFHQVTQFAIGAQRPHGEVWLAVIHHSQILQRGNFCLAVTSKFTPMLFMATPQRSRTLCNTFTSTRL